ncbi:type IV pilus assembly protein PilO [Rhodoferax ferrireducens]|uniref:Type IV pilus assembly protein PilO n=1 Tax=Rhodoferax ferrireducens TaxID=192843 RepID=A0ABU2CFZ5_9BURK|nr:type 4a pilus biogenesis protein PilO [Rhodoferax ferrireducens]MDR7380117.1 type IV pilus assembly protein PilO [Rhodoferax ferrireducens]
MAKKPSIDIDFKALQDSLQRQFRDLNPNDPSVWPVVPRSLLFLVVVVAVVAGLWYAWLSSYEEELIVEQTKEVELREAYKTRLVKAVNLDALKKQREQVQQYVTQLEKQLPSKAEMAALLSDVNQAGLGRSLQFELFRPGQVVVKDYYAELPISVRVTGRYHDIGAFASDVANLSRIVTLNNLSINPAQDGNLSMEVTARTFRYLDADEIAAQKPGAKK